MKIDRNCYIEDTWLLKKIDDHGQCKSFDCGNDDLNDYFNNDAVLHKQELLTETYCLQTTNAPGVIIALLDFCNDAMQFRNFEEHITIDERKHYRSLPAVKLTRFGVSKIYQRKNIGSHVLNMVKKLFVTDNRTGCRFITIDAYNKPEVLKFYQKNNFKFTTYKDRDRGTRSMYFDLKLLNINQ